MDRKRGQVSIFIIIGIVILAVISVVLYLTAEVPIEELDIGLSPLESSAKSVQTYVEGCLESIGLEAIEYIGSHGGYYNIESISEEVNTAYYFYLGENIMPSKGDVQEEIADYIDDNLFLCLQDFAIFEEQGLAVEYEDPLSAAIIDEDNVFVTLNLPITITIEDGQKQLDEFDAEIENINLGKMIDSASVIIASQEEDHDNICMSCIFKEMAKNDFKMELENFGEDTIIFSMLDNSTGLYLIYANKYTIYSCDNPPPDADAYFYVECVEEQKEELNYEFFVADIEDMEATVGERFYHAVDFSGTDVIFSDDTDLFDIDAETGEIDFVPEEIGNYTILIKAVDIFDIEEYRTFELIVE